jgi:hypothetical protein
VTATFIAAGAWYFNENLKERDHLEDIGIGGRIFKKALLEMGWKGVECINLAKDRDQWCAFVNTVMNLWVP